MTRKALKIFKKWITQNGLLFHEYLDETDFPDPERLDERGPKFQYPEWHKKQKDKGTIPKNLRGIDKQATWCKSNADGWVYGHGSFCLTVHKVPFSVRFVWMQNNANKAICLWLETALFRGMIDYVVVDSKAHDYDL